MSVVLGIDTAGPVIGAAVLGDGAPRQWSSRVVRGADGVLLPAIADLLESVETLDAVAVSVGPGAFTGLRVGVSTALGLAVARRVPVVCVSSLEARAAMCEGPVILSVLDARKSRVYAQWFGVSGDTLVERSVPVDLPLHDVLQERNGSDSFVAVGEGALLDIELINRAGGQVIDDPGQSPAWAVARFGQLRIEQALPPQEVALRYLRPPDAKKPVKLVES